MRIGASDDEISVTDTEGPDTVFYSSDSEPTAPPVDEDRAASLRRVWIAVVFATVAVALASIYLSTVSIQ